MLGDLIRAQLEARGMTSRAFREEMRVKTGEKLSRQRLSKWVKNGVRPDPDAFVAMLEVLAVPTTDQREWFEAAGHGRLYHAARRTVRQRRAS